MKKHIDTFLVKENKKCKEELFNKYEEVFNFYEELDSFMDSIKSKIKLRNDDFQGGTILGLFAKSLTTYRSIYFLFRQCFCNNSEELCRILFEEMVNIAYCSKGKKEARRYLSLHAINRLKIINTINEKTNEKYLPEGFKEEFFRIKSYKERKKDLINEIKKLDEGDIFNNKGKPKEIDLIDRIRKTDNKQLMNLYLTFYRIVSTGIHSSPEILRKYIDTDENGLMKGFRWGVLAEEVKNAPIFTSMYFMIINTEIISKYFGYPEKKSIGQYWDKLKSLGKENDYFFEKL